MNEEANIVIKKKLLETWQKLLAIGRACFRSPRRRKLMLVFTVTLVLGSLAGYGIGRFTANREAKRQAKEAAAQYGAKTAALEEELRTATIQKPEGRPWNLTLVNEWNPMETGYVPELADIGNGHSVDKRIAEELMRMMEDAKKAGLNPLICSSYRTVEYQEKLYDEYIGKEVQRGLNYWQALKKTRESTAYPGRSEHNIGLAVDIVSSDYVQLDEKQEQTAEAKWLAENCHKYGFILRYPVGKTDITGIIYEPWHYRYVGVEDATKIYEQGITLEEYLGEV